MSETDLSADVTRLYVAIGRLTREIRRAAPVAELGQGALGVLALVVKGGPQRLGELAAAEGVSAPTMTKIVAALEELDLASRAPDPADGRASLVAATDAGEQLFRSGKSTKLAFLAERIAALDPADREALAAAVPVLERLTSG